MIGLGALAGAGFTTDSPGGIGSVGTARWLNDTDPAGAFAVCRAGEGFGGKDFTAFSAMLHAVVVIAGVVGIPGAGNAFICVFIAGLVCSGAVGIERALHTPADGGVAAGGRR